MGTKRYEIKTIEGKVFAVEEDTHWIRRPTWKIIVDEKEYFIVGLLSPSPVRANPAAQFQHNPSYAMGVGGLGAGFTQQNLTIPASEVLTIEQFAGKRVMYGRVAPTKGNRNPPITGITDRVTNIKE